MIRRAGFVVLLLLLSIQTVHAWEIEENYTNLNDSRTFNNNYLNSLDNSIILMVTVTGDECYLANDYTEIQLVYNITNIITSQEKYLTSPDNDIVIASFYSIVPKNTYYKISYNNMKCASDLKIKYWYEWEVKEDTMLVENTTIIAVGIIFIVIYILYKEIVR